jgi:hypothetical protein
MGSEDPLAVLPFLLPVLAAVAVLIFGTAMIIRHWRR